MSEDRDLPVVLQQLQGSIRDKALSADEQRAIIQLVRDLLVACGKQRARPLPGQDMQEVRGQAHVKRALEVAAAGGHALLLFGPPQTGKTMLARTLPSILPATAVPTPFRTPMSTIALQDFVGEADLPGELTLAHAGVLLLRHVHEFGREHLAQLCRASETRVVAFPHEDGERLFPANFLLVATTMPCPCGFYGDAVRDCRCSTEMIRQHQQVMGEAIATCFDIQIEVFREDEELLSHHREERSEQIRERVKQARARQQHRYAQACHLWVNADLRSFDDIERYCQMETGAQRLLKVALQQLHLSPRSLLRVQSVAQTIADLDGTERIVARHIAEAVQYRPRF